MKNPVGIQPPCTVCFLLDSVAAVISGHGHVLAMISKENW